MAKLRRSDGELNDKRAKDRNQDVLGSIPYEGRDVDPSIDKKSVCDGD